MKQSPFESIKHLDPNGQEFWSARELYPILGYTNWNKFQDVIQRAKDAIENSGTNLQDHFYPEVKLVQTGSGAKRQISNRSVRHTLINRGIVPEELQPEEDTKKLPKKIQTFEEGLGDNLLG